MISLISLFILYGRGRSLLVNMTLVARARAESLRAIGRQTCWTFHEVVRTAPQAFASCSSMWLIFLVLG